MRVKTPTVLQMEAVECGAASLAIILAYYDRIVPLAELRIECGVSRDGSKASNIILAARRYGMLADGFKAEHPEQLHQLQPPYIIFWQFNHYLVVEGANKNWVFINDPATGPRKISWKEFDRGFTGVVLAIEPGPEFKKEGRKPNVILGLTDRLRGSVGALVYCILAGLLLVLPGLALPVFSQVFVDSVLVENRTPWLRPLILGMIITTVFQGLLSLLRLRYLRKLRIKLAVGMSSRFLWHILRLPVKFYAQRYAGEVSNRASLNNKVAQVLSGQLATTVIDAVILGKGIKCTGEGRQKARGKRQKENAKTSGYDRFKYMILFYALVMFAYDGVLTLIGTCFAAINGLALQWVARHRVDANRRLVQDWGKAIGVSIAA